MAPFKLTSWQRHRLRRELQQTRDALLFRRILAVLEYDHGRSAADIARELGVTRQTVHLWVAAYAQRRDPEALADESGRGRPRLLDEDQQHFLEVLLTLAPQDLGFPHTSWTVPLLREAVEVATEQTVSKDTIRRALHRLDYVWKRPRYDLEPDPEREKKTSHSPANPGPSPTQRRPGAGRNRPAALPAVACRLVEAW
ncbi:MAG TPA: helix-turn-helix domain-containing protein [Gemmataceae bacterium]|nr:helix-turn-helix domain-containing protein [Gemmataceae bacterium]